MKTNFPRLIICEGPKDQAFFRKLIEVRGLPRFHIRAAYGYTQFASAISKFELEETKAFRGLNDVLIVADNNDEPSKRFANACDHIKTKFGEVATPKEPLKPSQHRPRCTVLMIPWTDKQGTLESMLLEAARKADRGVGNHVDMFLSLLIAERWASPTRKDKAWLRTNLAGRCENDPFIPLGRVFTEGRHEGLIPVGDPSFDYIADLLSSM
jgi:Protein of unknown function (DUF3226)